MTEALVAVVDTQIVSALAWVESLLELEQLPFYSGKHFHDLAQVDLLPRERWLETHWTADKREHAHIPSGTRSFSESMFLLEFT